MRKRSAFAGHGSVESWVWQVVVNSVRNYRRNALWLTDLGPLDLHVTGANGEVAADRSLRAAVAALPERQRLVVFLHYYADLDYNAVAAILEIRPGTVGATLTAARSALREALKEQITDG